MNAATWPAIFVARGFSIHDSDIIGYRGQNNPITVEAIAHYLADNAERHATL